MSSSVELEKSVETLREYKTLACLIIAVGALLRELKRIEELRRTE